jgi:hypothetical protein
MSELCGNDPQHSSLISDAQRSAFVNRTVSRDLEIALNWFRQHKEWCSITDLYKISTSNKLNILLTAFYITRNFLLMLDFRVQVAELSGSA